MWEFELSGIEDLRELSGRLGVRLDVSRDVSILAEPVQIGRLVIPNSLATRRGGQAN
jgi:hypothetical protein